MQVIRKTTIETEEFQVGDSITIPIDGGQTFTATAHRVTDAGTLFIFDDCVDVARLNPSSMVVGSTFEQTALYRWLNSDFLIKFPTELSLRIDNLTIPSINEIYNVTDRRISYDKWEVDDMNQLPLMADFRYMLCGYFEYSRNCCTPYWLRSRAASFSTQLFAMVDDEGFLDVENPKLALGVRPEFLLKPLEIPLF